MNFKRRITVEQLNELSTQQMMKLKNWWKPSYGDACTFDGEKELIVFSDQKLSHYSMCAPLLDIGQMIQFLQENRVEFVYDYNEFFCKIFSGTKVKDTVDNLDINKSDFCDQLFEAVKVVL
jgi:hypothetical protein